MTRGAVGLGLMAIGAVVALRARSTAPGGAPAQTPASKPPSSVTARRPVPPRPPLPAARPSVSGGAVVFGAAWGSGPSELGRSAARESSPMAPMSFVPGPAGQALVLDQVNQRVQLVEGGRVVRSIPLPSETFDDVARLAGGRVAALDRLVAGSVAVVGPSGEVEREISLAGGEIERAGDVTSLHARADGLWVEVDHDRLVRIADGAGAPAESRSVVPGRFSADGASWLRARVDADRGVTVTSTPRAGGPPEQARVVFALPVLSVAALESDATGRVLLVATTIDEAPVAPYDVLRVEETLVVLDRQLAELRRIALPAKTTPDEQLVRYRVGPDGALYSLSLDDQGATLRRIDP